MSVLEDVKYLWTSAAAFFVLLGCVSDPWRHGCEIKVPAARTQIDSFLVALSAYREDVGNFPSTAEGLPALRENPGRTGWNVPYLPKDIPVDPWGVPYVYLYPGAHERLPDIFSYGADRSPGGEGINADIVSWHVSE